MTIIDIAGEPAGSALRYCSLTVIGTRRWTNGAAWARRLVDLDAINEDKFIRQVDRPGRAKNRNRAVRLFPTDRRRDNNKIIVSAVAKSIAGPSTEIALCRAQD